jgi:hypothetical protein
VSGRTLFDSFISRDSLILSKATPISSAAPDEITDDVIALAMGI